MTDRHVRRIVDRTPSRGVRQVAPGVIEIVAYAGRGAMLAWLAAIAILIAVGQQILFGSGAITNRVLGLLGHGVLWGPVGTDIGYRECQRIVDFYPGCHPDITPRAYHFDVILPLQIANGTVGETLFALLFMLAPFVYLLFWRHPPPLRLDGNRRVIYGWRPARLFGLIPGRLYLASVDHTLMDRQLRRYDALAGGTESGPILLDLQDMSDPARQRTFKVGPYASLPGEAPAAKMWARAKIVFGVDPEGTASQFPRAFHLPWWQRTSLLGMRRLPAGIEAEVTGRLDQSV